MSAHDTVSTTQKKIANWTVGKSTPGARNVAATQPSASQADITGVQLVRAALLLALMAVLAAGCGDARRAAAPAPPATQPATAPAPLLTIDRPGARALVAEEGTSQLSVTADLSGRGNAGELVSVTADCEDPGCRTGAQVDSTGRWSARVLLVAEESAPRVRLVAQSGAQVAIALARLRPRVRHAAATHHRARGHRTRRTAAPAAVAATPAPSTSTTVATAAPSAAPGAPSRMQVVGDSLAIGAQAPLAAQLPGWSIQTDARIGRPLAEGMGIVRSLRTAAPVLAISLFTNDGPGSVAALESAVRETIERQARGCVIWATVVRPPVGGVTYDRANDALARLAAANPRVMRLVPWARKVAENPQWLAPDGVHATPEGYAARAQLYADAARSCD